MPVETAINAKNPNCEIEGIARPASAVCPNKNKNGKEIITVKEIYRKC